MTDTIFTAELSRLEQEAGGELANLKSIIEQSAEAGARKVMSGIGLADAAARKDMDDLRQLLAAWRDAKTSARRALVEWVVRIFLALLLIALAVRLGLTDLMRG